MPPALKAWIDIIVQPMASVALNERGEHVGTLGEGKPLQLILTRSGAYDGDREQMREAAIEKARLAGEKLAAKRR